MPDYGISDALMDYLFRRRMFQREISCLGWPGAGIVSLTSDGVTGEVNFDFVTAWVRFMKERPKSVVMIHTHPPGMDEMSPTDWNMVHGWRIGFGVPVWYIVVTNGVSRYYLCTGDKKGTNRQDMGLMSFPNDSHEACYLYIVLYGLSMAKETLGEEGYSGIARSLNGSSELFSGILRRVEEWTMTGDKK